MMTILFLLASTGLMIGRYSGGRVGGVVGGGGGGVC